MSRSIKRRRTFLGAAAAIGATLALTAGLGVFAGTGAAAPMAAPTNTSPPTITGTPQAGQKLTGNNGTWSGSPTDYNDNWRRCDKSGGSCSDISGATGNTYTLTSADIGNTVRFQVGAANADGRTVASSVPSAVITAASATTTTTTTTSPASNGCAKTGGTIPVASISPPARLTVDQMHVSPSTVTYGTRSLTARFHVSACSGSVEGALVYVTAVPYGQFAVPNEEATGSDGWATLQFTALPGFPVSNKQQLLVMFVRARKQGDSILGGISTRRLVSFHVTRG
ncbi:MAG TPA: hypothetical protein VG652_04335 [Gaiellaceae bacterium]|nr:hypothetical protein [Gaiellaceae bacterium]